MQEFKSDINTWVRETIAELGLSHQKVANRLKCHRNTIGNWVKPNHYVPPLAILALENMRREWGIQEQPHTLN